MADIEKLRKEYEKAVYKKQELTERLRQTEKTEPTNFNQIWIIRDQIAYWEGKTEGLKFALEEIGG